MQTLSNADPVAEGMALLQDGRLGEAEQRFRRAIQQDENDANALHGLGIIAHQTGHFTAAVALFDRAIQVHPGFAAAYVNRGNSLSAQLKYEQAVESFGHALDISAEMPSALLNLANALHALGRLDPAIDALTRARAIQPDSPEILNNLGNLYKDRGEVHEAVRCYQAALDLMPLLQQAASNRLAALKVDATLSPQAVLAHHRAWSGWFEQVSASAPLLTNSPDIGRTLRIGYVSPDCHTAVPAFLYPVIAAHHRDRFQVFCYFNNPQDPQTLALLGVAGANRIMRGMDDGQVAQAVHDDRIDILVDIAGHTGHNRLGVFARRPAPVQITWLDYLCTTGMEAMDYRITDAIADPPGSEAFHSEELLRLPHTQWCWQPPAEAPPVTDLPASRNGFITFGSFNNAQKLSEATLALWRSLLEQLPRSRLRLTGLAEGRARARILGGLACDPVRVDFLPRLDVATYRRAYGEVDIALDPMPFSGATTTLDALWQGVPVLTLPGATSFSRSTASLLTELGLPGWIAAGTADFVSRARDLSSNVVALAALRASLRKRLQASTLVDVSSFTPALEALYRTAWADWCTRRFDADGGRQTFAGSDQVLLAASSAIDAGNPAQAIDLMKPLLQLRPQWDLLKREYGRAALAWAGQHPQARAAWDEPVAPLPRRVAVSVIICSIRAEYFERIKQTLHRQFAGHDIEVIGIHDAKSLAEGYNRGAGQARGEILIFCHDDIDIVHDDFGTRVLRHLQDHDVVGVIGSSELVNGNWSHAGPPHLHGQIIHRPADGKGHLYFAAGFHVNPATGVKALDGVFIAAKREVWERLRYDQQTFDGFHLYDADFTYRAHLSGYRIAVPLDLLLIHFSLGQYDSRWQKYNMRFLAKFPELTNLLSLRRYASLHIKLQSLEQVGRMHAALLHHRFGT